MWRDLRTINEDSSGHSSSSPFLSKCTTYSNLTITVTRSQTSYIARCIPRLIIISRLYELSGSYQSKKRVCLFNNLVSSKKSRSFASSFVTAPFSRLSSPCALSISPWTISLSATWRSANSSRIADYAIDQSVAGNEVRNSRASYTYCMYTERAHTRSSSCTPTFPTLSLSCSAGDRVHRYVLMYRDLDEATTQRAAVSTISSSSRSLQEAPKRAEGEQEEEHKRVKRRRWAGWHDSLDIH